MRFKDPSREIVFCKTFRGTKNEGILVLWFCDWDNGSDVFRVLFEIVLSDGIARIFHEELGVQNVHPEQRLQVVDKNGGFTQFRFE